MNIKKLLVGGITAGVLYFLLGWLIYGTAPMMDFMKAHPGIVSGYNRATPDYIYLTIGNLLSGFLLAYIFVKGNVGSLVNGFITGAILGLLMSASMDMMNYGITLLASKKMILADVLAATVLSALTGAVTATVMGKSKTA